MFAITWKLEFRDIGNLRMRFIQIPKTYSKSEIKCAKYILRTSYM